ncbi:hypothetical protein LU293_02650 [Moraxella nasovis]|uniref:hypothetical protein n=1 Tax=Moraxella nasovis TaxID=2904121 RepID=UPI001F60668F|nr:hypothetical protein [Moraxella nasovis]UNU73817.1 hypothetical protein LU293_02650 [Moraxella nasovis]
MANFSPSLQFQKRWQAAPAQVKDMFHQELDDIIDMLKGDTLAKDYRFRHGNFADTIEPLLTKHQENLSTSTSTVLQNPESLSLTDDKSPINEHELELMEERIIAKLNNQLDEFVIEHIDQLSDELRSWLKTAVKSEIAQYK